MCIRDRSGLTFRQIPVLPSLQFRQRPHAMLNGTEHRSPTLMNSTPGPASMTSPVISCPSARPSGAVVRPRTMCWSLPQILVETTLRMTRGSTRAPRWLGLRPARPQPPGWGRGCFRPRPDQVPCRRLPCCLPLLSPWNEPTDQPPPARVLNLPGVHTSLAYMPDHLPSFDASPGHCGCRRNRCGADPSTPWLDLT